MIVKVLGQGPGAAAAAPKSGSGPPPTGRATAPRADSGAAPAPAARTSASQDLFDVNGDGAIENWSVLHGGDSFETLDPPPPGTDTTRAHRSADAALHTADRLRPADAGHSRTPAAIHHAHSAYRRDGMAGAPVAHDASTPGNTHAPAAPPVSVAQSGGGAALPSSR